MNSSCSIKYFGEDIVREIGNDEVSVVVEEGLDDRDEGFGGSEDTTLNGLEHSLEARIGLDLTSAEGKC